MSTVLTKNFIIRRTEEPIIIPRDIYHDWLYNTEAPNILDDSKLCAGTGIPAEIVKHLAPLLKKVQERKAGLGKPIYDYAEAHKKSMYDYFVRNGFSVEQLLLFFSVTLFAPYKEELRAIQKALYQLLLDKQIVFWDSRASLEDVRELEIIPETIYADTTYTPLEARAPLPTPDYVISLLNEVQKIKAPFNYFLHNPRFFQRHCKLAIYNYLQQFSPEQLILLYRTSQHDQYKKNITLVREILYELILDENALIKALDLSIYTTPFRISLIMGMCDVISDMPVLFATRDTKRCLTELSAKYCYAVQNFPKDLTIWGLEAFDRSFRELSKVIKSKYDALVIVEQVFSAVVESESDEHEPEAYDKALHSCSPAI